MIHFRTIIALFLIVVSHEAPAIERYIVSRSAVINEYESSNSVRNRITREEQEHALAQVAHENLLVSSLKSYADENPITRGVEAEGLTQVRIRILSQTISKAPKGNVLTLKMDVDASPPDQTTISRSTERFIKEVQHVGHPTDKAVSASGAANTINDDHAIYQAFCNLWRSDEGGLNQSIFTYDAKRYTENIAQNTMPYVSPRSEGDPTDVVIDLPLDLQQGDDEHAYAPQWIRGSVSWKIPADRLASLFTTLDEQRIPFGIQTVTHEVYGEGVFIYFTEHAEPTQPSIYHPHLSTRAIRELPTFCSAVVDNAPHGSVYDQRMMYASVSLPTDDLGAYSREAEFALGFVSPDGIYIRGISPVRAQNFRSQQILALDFMRYIQNDQPQLLSGTYSNDLPPFRRYARGKSPRETLELLSSQDLDFLRNQHVILAYESELPISPSWISRKDIGWREQIRIAPLQFTLKLIGRRAFDPRDPANQVLSFGKCGICYTLNSGNDSEIEYRNFVKTDRFIPLLDTAGIYSLTGLQAGLNALMCGAISCSTSYRSLAHD